MNDLTPQEIDRIKYLVSEFKEKNLIIEENNLFDFIIGLAYLLESDRLLEEIRQYQPPYCLDDEN
jgi:hypothetical protein